MDDERSRPKDRAENPGDRTQSPRVSDAVEDGMEAYLLFTARGAPEDEAFAAALGRSIRHTPAELTPWSATRTTPNSPWPAASAASPPTRHTSTPPTPGQPGHRARS